MNRIDVKMNVEQFKIRGLSCESLELRQSSNVIQAYSPL
jgi:hypothetical protein